MLVRSFREVSGRRLYPWARTSTRIQRLSTGGVVIPNSSEVTELRAMSWECRAACRSFLYLIRFLGLTWHKITVRSQIRRCRSTARGHFVGTPHSGTGARE